MSPTHLEDLLSATLAERADEHDHHANALPHDLLSDVATRARSTRRNRRGLVAGGTAVAVAVCIVGALELSGPEPTSIRPGATSGSPSVPPSTTTMATHTASLDAPIAVLPRAERRGKRWTIVTSESRATVPGEGAVTWIGESAGITVALVSSEKLVGGVPADARLIRVNRDGSVETAARGRISRPVFDPDDPLRYAITRQGRTWEEPSTLEVRRLDSTSVVNRSLPAMAALVRWGPSGVIMLAGTLQIWDPDTGAVLRTPADFPSFVRDVYRAAGDPERLFVFAGEGRQPKTYAVDARTLSTWSVIPTPNEPNVTLSPDGRWAIGGRQAVPTDGTGVVALALPAGTRIGGVVAWEDSARFLAVTETGVGEPGAPWVRCDVTDGRCAIVPLPAEQLVLPFNP